MTLPLAPPLEPMLGRRADSLPIGELVYEPKWDGFRCLAFRDGDAIDRRSRHGRPLARYFPELVAAIAALPEPRFVLDGEIVVTSERGFDFEALLARVHPAASRVERMSGETPATFVANQTYPFAVVLDARNVYWTDFTAGGSVQQVGK